MPTLTKELIERETARLGDIQPWWHDIELPYGIRTIGRDKQNQQANFNDAKWTKIKDALNVAGHTVLDIGCNEGFYCHEMLALGATRVVGVDINAHRIEKARFAAETKGLTQLSFLQESVYELTPAKFGGTFDVALALGMLHRVPDPYGFLAKTAELAKTIVLEWSSLDHDEPIMRFAGGGYKEYDRDNTAYWRITRRCVKAILHREGFQFFCDIVPNEKRAIMVAAKDRDNKALRVKWQSINDASSAERPAAQPPSPLERRRPRWSLLPHRWSGHQK